MKGKNESIHSFSSNSSEAEGIQTIWYFRQFRFVMTDEHPLHFLRHGLPMLRWMWLNCDELKVKRCGRTLANWLVRSWQSWSAYGATVAESLIRSCNICILQWRKSISWRRLIRPVSYFYTNLYLYWTTLSLTYLQLGQSVFYLMSCLELLKWPKIFASENLYYVTPLLRTRMRILWLKRFLTSNSYCTGLIARFLTDENTSSWCANSVRASIFFNRSQAHAKRHWYKNTERRDKKSSRLKTKTIEKMLEYCVMPITVLPY